MPIAPQLFQGGCVTVYGTYKRFNFRLPLVSRVGRSSFGR